MARPYNNVSISAPSWLVKKIGEREYKKCFERFKPATLLDIGCGGGEKKTVIPENIKYTGVDHPGTLHDTSHINVFSDAYGLPFKTGSYEFVFCTGVLEHLEEPQKAVHEAYRVLEPGGMALYTIPLFWHLHEEPRDFFRYTEHGIRYLFQKAGFQRIEINPMSGFWITFGSEFNYYIDALPGRPLKLLKKPWISLNNLIFMTLEKIDRKINPESTKWTWMYLVVATK